MKTFLVGIDGTDRARRALAWAKGAADKTGAALELMIVVDPAMLRATGATEEMARNAAAESLGEYAAEVRAEYPDMSVTTRIAAGNVVDQIIEASRGCDLIVMGTHHGKSIAEAVGGARGLRVAVAVNVPTVIVPCDWERMPLGEGILVGVGPDDVSEGAVEFGVQQALATALPLTLVSVWGLPPFLSRPAVALGGGLQPVGEQFQAQLDERVRLLTDAYPSLDVSGRAVEASSPTQGLVTLSENYQLLVLGTHSRSALGRKVFGSTNHGVLANIKTPTVIVPKP